jgi:regulatory protein
MNTLRLSKEQAFEKIKSYCAYQERSHSEVKEKLYGYGLYSTEVSDSIALLIEENFLNEERFAIQFASGKFRLKQWGRLKIRYALRQKQVSDYCIKKALSLIEESDYQDTLQKLAAAKWQQLRGENNLFVKKKKVQAYLLQRGFEGDAIQAQINML